MRARVLSTCLLAAALVSGARAADPGGNTVITSDTLTIDYKRLTASFEKNVVVVDPDVKITADTINVVFTQEQTIRSVTALGNVTVLRENQKATSDKAIYLQKTGEVVLIGSARLSRGTDALEGDKITFWINEERVICEPGRLVIFPRSREALSLPGRGGL